MHTQKSRLVETMVICADQLSRSIASATWHAVLDDRREGAYEIMQVIADKQGVDRIRMFNREGKLMFTTGPRGRLWNSPKHPITPSASST